MANVRNNVSDSDFVEVCYRDDPNIADCIRRNIEKVPTILTEDSSYVKTQQYEPIEPTSFTDVPFIYAGQMTTGRVVLESGTVHGLSNFELLDVRPKVDDPKKFILDFDGNFYLNLKCDYTMVGQVIQIPVKIKGKVDLHFEEVKMKMHMAGDVVKREGKDYLNLTSTTWRCYDLKNIYLGNSDTIDSYPALNVLFKGWISSSWRQLHRFMSPPIESATAPFIRERLQKSFSMYHYDVILPETRKLSRHIKPYFNH